MTDIAKLFVTGRSQAVRLPREYRFEGDEVFIRRDPVSGDVVLSRKPENWDGFLALAARTDVPADFMADRQDAPAPERELF
jgi:antitoxin VapB